MASPPLATHQSLRNIPITVFTGFLGAGKTSIILSLLPQLPKDYRVVLLKNEFGDVEVDSQLAKQSSLTAVSEILNGCMCCVLVGQMKTALLEIREKYRPDRIIIECSGSAFPATLAFQIRELERETEGDLKLDAIVTVIDAENFSGYEDTSPTARMQASYTDVILIVSASGLCGARAKKSLYWRQNKSEHISERALDILIDHLNTLNDSTPKIRCNGRSGVDPNLILGLDSKLFSRSESFNDHHHNEVETVTVYRATHLRAVAPHEHHHRGQSDAACSRDDDHQQEPQHAITDIETSHIEEEHLKTALESLSKETVWRVKGFVKFGTGVCILNWAFGRYELTALVAGRMSGDLIRLTVMGERGEVKRAARKFAGMLEARVA